MPSVEEDGRIRPLERAAVGGHSEVPADARIGEVKLLARRGPRAKAGGAVDRRDDFRAIRKTRTHII